MTAADCRRLDSLVTPYVDGQLSDADRRAVEAHLRACSPCHSRVGAERAVRELIQTQKAALGRPCAPSALRAHCSQISARAGGGAPPAAARGGAAAPASFVRRAAPLALAASVALLVGGGFLYQLTDSSTRVLAAELTADHVKCFAMNGLLHTHDGAAAVERSMLDGFGWRMQLPEGESTAGLELVGSRPCLYGEGKIAHIMYRHNGQPVSLFMLPRSTRAQEVVQVLGHKAAIWCAGDRTFVLVAREPGEEVERLASFVQASLR
jgi:anti-sigma factor RsiW